jgi:hypothetical protein
MIGEVDGIWLFEPETVDRMRAPHTDGRTTPPPFMETPMPLLRFGLGFELSRPGEQMHGEGSFGHGSHGGRQGYAHPDHGVAVGYQCTNSACFPPEGPDARWLPWTAALRELCLPTKS